MDYQAIQALIAAYDADGDREALIHKIQLLAAESYAGLLGRCMVCGDSRSPSVSDAADIMTASFGALSARYWPLDTLSIASLLRDYGSTVNYLSADFGLGDPNEKLEDESFFLGASIPSKFAVDEFAKIRLSELDDFPSGRSDLDKDVTFEKNMREQYPVNSTNEKIWPVFPEVLMSGLQAYQDRQAAQRRQQSQDYGLARDDGTPFRRGDTLYSDHYRMSRKENIDLNIPLAKPVFVHLNAVSYHGTWGISSFHSWEILDSGDEAVFLKEVYGVDGILLIMLDGVKLSLPCAMYIVPHEFVAGTYQLVEFGPPTAIF